MSITGRCACGDITLVVAADTPVGTRQCWCRQCQKIAAGGPTHNAIFLSEDVQIDGALASSFWVAASGNTLTFSFCSACGTQVYAQSSARMHLKTVRLGVLDEPQRFRPEMAIWTVDAPEWAQLDPAIAHYEGQPPAPALPEK